MGSESLAANDQIARLIKALKGPGLRRAARSMALWWDGLYREQGCALDEI